DLLPLLVVGLRHDRDMDDLDRQVARRIELEVAVEAKVDDARDAVVEEGLPARVAQVPDAVRPDDGAETRRAAVLGQVPAEVADVDAPVPGESSARRQQELIERREASSR